ncbi:hypothetical protein [Infirmifilum sp.]|uniref:hypothetical protein n=1 Tax=Infirmifilum sp. TaxID=2856575 RepID=UPI003D0DF919
MYRMREAVEFLIDVLGRCRVPPLVVGFSGGKDSTAAVHLVVEALGSLEPGRRPRDIYVVYTDTLLEHPSRARYHLLSPRRQP